MDKNDLKPVEEFVQFAAEVRFSCGFVGVLILVCILLYVFCR